MHKFLNKIKKFEQKPFVIKNFINMDEVKLFNKLFQKLPIEINNKRQKILKKKWSSNYEPDLQKIYLEKLNLILEKFSMDNPKTKDNYDSLGLFQESFSPVSLHVDSGFDFNKIIYKQTLLPLSEEGETVIFKNRFYGCSTTFSIDPVELSAKGYNKRSSEHLNLFGGRDFDKNMHKKYLNHEDINNLKGLEIDLIYKWNLGDLLVFDRTALHCSSSNLKSKKLGLTSLMVKL